MPNAGLLDLPQRLKRAEELRTLWRVQPRGGIPLEEVMKAAYWTHVHQRMTVGDRVEVVAEDGAYAAEIELVMKRPGEMKFRIWHKIDFQGAEPIKQHIPGDFFVQWVPGGNLKHCVIQRSTGQRMAEGLDKEAAVAEADRLNATLKAA